MSWVFGEVLTFNLCYLKMPCINNLVFSACCEMGCISPGDELQIVYGYWWQCLNGSFGIWPLASLCTTSNTTKVKSNVWTFIRMSFFWLQVFPSCYSFGQMLYSIQDFEWYLRMRCRCWCNMGFYFLPLFLHSVCLRLKDLVTVHEIGKLVGCWYTYVHRIFFFQFWRIKVS
jgi:hypothetical protein